MLTLQFNSHCHTEEIRKREDQAIQRRRNKFVKHNFRQIFVVIAPVTPLISCEYPFLTARVAAVSKSNLNLCPTFADHGLTYASLPIYEKCHDDDDDDDVDVVVLYQYLILITWAFTVFFSPYSTAMDVADSWAGSMTSEAAVSTTPAISSSTPAKRDYYWLRSFVAGGKIWRTSLRHHFQVCNDLLEVQSDTRDTCSSLCDCKSPSL